GHRHSIAVRIDHRVVRGVFRFVDGLRLWVRSGITIQLGEDRGTPQLVAGRGAAKVDGVAPGAAVSFVDQLRNRNLREIRIAEELCAIEKRALVSFCRQMNALGRAVSRFGQVVTFQDVEDLDQGDATRRRRWSADDFVSAVGATNGLALLHLIMRKVLGRNQASTLLNGGCQFMCYRAVVEIVGVFGDAPQGLRQLELLENLTGLVIVAIALENAVRLGKLLQIRILKRFGLVVLENEAIASQPD